jgi:hypothetical protein
MSKPTLALRRQMRIGRLEAARLRAREQLDLCTEPTPEELVIRNLEHAASLLAAMAREADEQTKRLHECLQDRKVVAKMDPMKYQDVQKERWMSERRAVVLSEDGKATRLTLDALRRGSYADRPPGQFIYPVNYRAKMTCFSRLRPPRR